MNLHEYQAKQLLKGFDVRVLGGSPVLQSASKLQLNLYQPQ